MGRVYDRRQWPRVRREQLVREPLCRHCKEAGILRPAHHVDHIIPISKGGAWYDEDNLQSLCAECHSRKTLKDEGKNPKAYVPGCTADGLPLDKRHHWYS